MLNSRFKPESMHKHYGCGCLDYVSHATLQCTADISSNNIKLIEITGWGNSCIGMFWFFMNNFVNSSFWSSRLLLHSQQNRNCQPNLITKLWIIPDVHMFVHIFSFVKVSMYVRMIHRRFVYERSYWNQPFRHFLEGTISDAQIIFLHSKS